MGPGSELPFGITKPGSLEPYPSALPSEHDDIAISHRLTDYTRANIQKTDRLNTIIMLNGGAGSVSLKTLREALINPRMFTTKTALAADEFPCDIFLLPVKRSLRAFTTAMEQQLFLRNTGPRGYPPGNAIPFGDDVVWTINRQSLRFLVRSRLSVANHIERNYGKTEDKPRLAAVLANYDTVIAEARDNAAELQCKLQNDVSKQAILEARKSVDQADAVRRIAVVGIIFIPLSFATSSLGMNFEQFGTGTIHVGYFVLLAALSGLVAWALAASIQPAEKFWSKAREAYHERSMWNPERALDAASVRKRTLIWDWLQQFSAIEWLDDLWRKKRRNWATTRMIPNPCRVLGFLLPGAAAVSSCDLPERGCKVCPLGFFFWS